MSTVPIVLGFWLATSAIGMAGLLLLTEVLHRRRVQRLATHRARRRGYIHTAPIAPTDHDEVTA